MRWNEKTHMVVGGGGVRFESKGVTGNAAAFKADTTQKTVLFMDSGKGLEQE